MDSQLLNKIKNKLVQNIAPEQIYLFGSANQPAIYDPNKSDIDLLLIMKTKLSYRKRYASARSCLRKFGLPFDILVYTPSEIRRLLTDKNSVISEALSTGTKIYEK